MRQIITATMFLLLSFSLFSQQAISQPSLSKEDYFEKSRKQKKTGRVFLAGGAGLIVVSLIIPRGDLVREGAYCGPGAGILCNEEYKNDGLKSGVLIAGGLSALGSIPFFIASKKNLRSATSVSFKLEHTNRLFNQNLVSTSLPAIKVKVSL
jgi:hypothetical protein